MVEIYYNSGQFSCTLKLLEKEFSHPSSMFLALADFYEKKGLVGFSHNRLARYEIIYDFLKEQLSPKELLKYRDALMYDLYLRENLKSRPSFASDQKDVKYQIRDFFAMEEEHPVWLPGYEGYDSRQMIKMAHMEHMEDGSYVLFDYKNRDPLSKNAKAVRFIYEERGTNGEKRVKESQKREGNENSCQSGQGVWHRVPLLSES